MQHVLRERGTHEVKEHAPATTQHTRLALFAGRRRTGAAQRLWERQPLQHRFGFDTDTDTDDSCSDTDPTSAQPTPTPAPGNMQVVLITNNSNGSFDFTPARLTIRVGTTVIWKNRSSAPHTVTSDDGTTFDSGTVPAGGTFHFTFKTAGTFSYHCNIHPYMRSMIIVV